LLLPTLTLGEETRSNHSHSIVLGGLELMS
jgi:hypothetical protein